MDEQFPAFLQTTFRQIRLQVLETVGESTLSVSIASFESFSVWADTSNQIRLNLVIQSYPKQEVNAHESLKKRNRWQDAKYRQSYLEASIEQGVASQVKINREKRGLSQNELAQKIGTKQSAISRTEDDCYGKQNLQTLIKIAHAFDCALEIKFIPYSKLALYAEHLDPESTYAKSYESEITNDHSKSIPFGSQYYRVE